MITLFSFSDWFSGMGFPLQILWTIALLSSLLFVIQVVMALLGFDGESEIEGGAELDGIDPSFTLISFRSILAFLVCFSWIQIYLLSIGWGFWSSFALAFLAGLSALFMVAYLLYKLIELNESGTVNLNKLKNKEGTVYIPIPEARSGSGKVFVTLEGKQMEFDAITDGQALATDEKVVVVERLDNNILLVKS